MNEKINVKVIDLDECECSDCDYDCDCICHEPEEETVERNETPKQNLYGTITGYEPLECWSSASDDGWDDLVNKQLAERIEYLKEVAQGLVAIGEVAVGELTDEDIEEVESALTSSEEKDTYYIWESLG